MEEWVRQSRFGHIEFRSFNGERHACIKDRLQLWQVIMAARPLAMDVERTAGCLGLMPPQVRSAFAYYEAYPEEIDFALADNDIDFERLRGLLPSIERIEVAPSPVP